MVKQVHIKFGQEINMNYFVCSGSSKSNNNFTNNSKELKTKIINTNFTQQYDLLDTVFTFIGMIYSEVLE